ncbi:MULTISPECIES: DUF3237 domain-containing protein [Novosphingobium]|uniref:UPF0311 protein HT578_01145 n=1 Tax=Novosphingobium decolorationis TaxID=2698673 RepID=A0ABX8E2N2_9SPHN|nr:MULTISPECIES: DUF3237 domain-containing protein [Novosphingobium]MED5546555.1 DUF3237 domain-containing protein [Pseudomonadota bacterium]QVM82490.1 DUF3237 domain-containing protein [Novosphingobium decolorationis]GAM06933.1 hypothetical conserved protein [Novosphingobium sp. MBES04]
MTPTLEHICEFEVELSPPHEMGENAQGTRRIIPIVGGRVSGTAINGKLLAIGADWQTVRTDDVAYLDARYAIETDDGAVIEVISQGLRHMPPEAVERIAAGETLEFSEYYMRTAIRLDTGHPDYAWVNRSLFVAAGGKTGSTVYLSVHRVG